MSFPATVGRGGLRERLDDDQEAEGAGRLDAEQELHVEARAVGRRRLRRRCSVSAGRGRLSYVSHKDWKAVATDLKAVYRAVTLEEAERQLTQFEEAWAGSYPVIARSWRQHWSRVVPMFGYPAAIRRAIYTTNTIESLNMTLRKVTKNRSLFPNDEAVFKLMYMALRNISQRWTMPIRNWSGAMNQFAILFDGRVPMGGLNQNSLTQNP